MSDTPRQVPPTGGFSALPEAISRPEEHEKQLAADDGKEVAGASEKQVLELSVPPEAIDPEWDKECVSSVRSDQNLLVGEALEARNRKQILGLSTRWWIIAASLLLFVIVSIGAIVGGVEGSAKRPPSRTTIPSRTLIGVSVISTSTHTSPPTGTYALSWSTPQVAQAACLVKGSEEPAWSCKPANDSELQISIQDTTGASLYSLPATTDKLSYGIQALSTSSSDLLLVLDESAPQRGPAFYFQVQYDKQVVVREGALSDSTGKTRKRSSRNSAVPGDKPWICHWNGTVIEGFLYTRDFGGKHISPTGGSAAPAYPHPVKIEDRRLPDSPSPYCVQYEILNDWTWNVITDPTTGQPLMVNLKEDDPPFSAYSNADKREVIQRGKRSGGAIPGSCYCQWMSDQ